MIKEKAQYTGEYYNSLLHINEAKLVNITDPINQCIEIL